MKIQFIYYNKGNYVRDFTYIDDYKNDSSFNISKKYLKNMKFITYVQISR